MRNLMLSILTTSLALGIVFLLVEAGLRIAWPQIFLPHPPGMYSIDEDIGYVLTPGFTGEFRAPEFRVGVTIGQSGLRGVDAEPPAEHSRRILCLGDSFTWGWGVEDTDTYPSVLESFAEDRLSNSSPRSKRC